uniref:Neuregulin 1 n=1 Tax=Myripristis murdjan TaxID=586833 RepID=A0A667XX06_9TELE
MQKAAYVSLRLLAGSALHGAAFLFQPPHSAEFKREETVAGGEGREECPEGNAEEGGGVNEERSGALGILGLARMCCVCIEMEQIQHCLHSEKICILPILACLLSLALCTAGLKWVFVDKIFEYEPPTHLDPKRIGQDPLIISADPALGLPVSFPLSSSFAASLTTTIITTTAHPGVLLKEKTMRPVAGVTCHPSIHPSMPLSSHSSSSVPSFHYLPASHLSFQLCHPTTSITPAPKTSSHVTRCNDNQKSYCVNGGECFTLEVVPGSTKFLCRCPNEFTGDRCQNYVMASFYKAEELYQKRVLTITGICIALLVVGIMCVVAYCKTKKQRKKFHHSLRQSLKNDRNNTASLANGPKISNLPLENFQNVNVSYYLMIFVFVSSTDQTCLNPCKQTHTLPCLCSWNNGWSNGVLSGSESVLVMSVVENSQPATPSHQNHLNASGGTRDLYDTVQDCRDNPSSYRDSLLSDRYVSAVADPNQLSPITLTSPGTPGSPPSEMLAPTSSLATSVPSVVVSPSAEEEHPLLLATTLQSHSKSSYEHHNQLKRKSSHYNHGQDIHSPPPSPPITMEDDDYQISCGHDTTAAMVPPVSPQNLCVKLDNISSNNNGHSAKRPIANGHMGHNVEYNVGSMLKNETEEEPLRSITPSLIVENPTALLVRSMDSSRTNPASLNDNWQARLSFTKPDPVAE